MQSKRPTPQKKRIKKTFQRKILLLVKALFLFLSTPFSGNKYLIAATPKFKLYQKKDKKSKTTNTRTKTSLTKGATPPPKKSTSLAKQVNTPKTTSSTPKATAKTDQVLNFLNPIKGAALSSTFGYRMHPVLKKTKFHKGMDLAAKKGTPILAPANGVVLRVGKAGGYGNYIRIQHHQDIETAYAHLSRYAKNLRPGTLVKKGDVIGYVGNTGRSTGPHLHFEVIKNGKHVNPKVYLT